MQYCCPLLIVIFLCGFICGSPGVAHSDGASILQGIAEGLNNAMRLRMQQQEIEIQQEQIDLERQRIETERERKSAETEKVRAETEAIRLLDGFNLTVIGVAVPKIAEYLRLKPPDLGMAMSAGQFGPLLGAALLDMLADRAGRKRMLVACALTFGLFTLLCAFITSVGELALFRFIAGLGMGGAVPTAIAFGTEYAPTRSRATLATAMYAGVLIGATISGLAALYLLPHFGWQSLFIMGGAIPVVIALVMAVLLPESLTFPVRREVNGQAKVRRIVAKISPPSRRIRTLNFTRPTRGGPECRSSTFFWKDAQLPPPCYGCVFLRVTT